MVLWFPLVVSGRLELLPSCRELFLVAWVHFLFPYTCLNDCLVKVLGCLNSVPGSLSLVPWLPGEVSWLPGFNFCFHGCLVKIYFCLNEFRSLDLIPWLPGRGSWFPGLGSMVESGLLLGSIYFLDLCTWFKVPGEGFWLPGFSSWLSGLGSMVA